MNSQKIQTLQYRNEQFIDYYININTRLVKIKAVAVTNFREGFKSYHQTIYLYNIKTINLK